MRMLALAQARQDLDGVRKVGYSDNGVGSERRTVFICAMLPEAMEDRLCSEGCEVVRISASPGSVDDAEQTLNVIRRVARSGGFEDSLADIWLLADGYHFGAVFQQGMKTGSTKLMIMDDNGENSEYDCNAILNQNLHASADMYVSRAPSTNLLLGTDYVLLRREFKKWIVTSNRCDDTGRNVLVTMGGVDSGNITLRCLDALDALSEDINVKVIVGSTNPNRGIIEGRLRSFRHQSAIMSSSCNIAQIMWQTDVAITAAGSTCWELAFMGVPMLEIAIADNQRSVGTSLAERGVAIDLGWYEAISAADIAMQLAMLLPDTAKRKTMSRKGRLLVDGLGGDRLAAFIDGRHLVLRRVEEADCDLLLRWANDEEARRQSRSQRPISREEHVAWFGRKFRDSNCRFYIGVDVHGLPLGCIRFDIKKGVAEISLNVDAGARNRGIGSRMIRLAALRLLRESDIETILAKIKKENSASIGAFRKAGFIEQGIVNIEGCQVCVMTVRREAV